MNKTIYTQGDRHMEGKYVFKIDQVAPFYADNF